MKEYVLNLAQDLDHVLADYRPVTNLRLGEILIEHGIIGPEHLKLALGDQRAKGGHLGHLLIELGMATREQINWALSGKLGIPYVRFGTFEIPQDILALIPADVAHEYKALPLARHNGRLVVAMENPLDWQALEILRFKSNLPIETVIASEKEMAEALNRYYGKTDEVEIEQMVDDLDLEPATEPEKDDLPSLRAIEQEAQKKPVVRLVNAVIMQGIVERASDINIRPEKERVTIYYRVDGKLRFSRALGKSLLPALVSRIKIMGRMNIAERRRPQDGATRVIREGNVIDLRISIMPTINGESVVIRILDKTAGLKALDQLGLHEHELAAVKRILSHNHGIMLTTGPTGSGKSTTLYALLNEVKKREPHILTVEDPVEYDQPGIEQIQINSQIGYGFAEALRHILRHDPDVVMVGEIRDTETARIANKAALTGHLVLSTLHTNDAASTITRLIDMGIEPYLLSSTLLGVIAQRLIRLNCPHCLVEESVEEEVRELLQVPADETFYRGKGCEECRDTGYRGRMAVVEVLEVTPTVAHLINTGANTQQIKEESVRQGMTALTQNALVVARNHKTSLAEVFATRLE